MRLSKIRLLIRLAILLVWLSRSIPTSAAPVSSPTAPVVFVDLAKLGWAPPRNVSDREFFRDFTLEKLFAQDVNTRVVFLTEDVLVAYHTKQEGEDWRRSPRSIEAFFISSKDGSLLVTRRWSTGLRRSIDDLADSQARLIPLDGGRFLVVKNGVITLYSLDGELLRQRKLEPSTDLWAAQSIASGRGMVLRGNSASVPVKYRWLTLDTLETKRCLETKYEMPEYRGRDYAIGPAVADEKSLFERTRSGIRKIDLEQNAKIICDDPLCRETGNLSVLSAHYLGWSGMSGIGVVEKDRGLVWSRSVETKYQHNAFEFGHLETAISGTKFALWAVANGKPVFDGVEIKDLTILVYDVANLKAHPLVFRWKPRGDWAFGLSPKGTKLAIFDQGKVQIYRLQ